MSRHFFFFIIILLALARARAQSGVTSTTVDTTPQIRTPIISTVVVSTTGNMWDSSTAEATRDSNLEFASQWKYLGLSTSLKIDHGKRNNADLELTADKSQRHESQYVEDSHRHQMASDSQRVLSLENSILSL